MNPPRYIFEVHRDEVQNTNRRFVNENQVHPTGFEPVTFGSSFRWLFDVLDTPSAARWIGRLSTTTGSESWPQPQTSRTAGIRKYIVFFIVTPDVCVHRSAETAVDFRTDTGRGIQCNRFSCIFCDRSDLPP